MTYRTLLKKLQGLNKQQLQRPVKIREGCSGNWTEIYVAEIADCDMWHEGEEPGTSRHAELSEFTELKPAVKAGEFWMQHDH